LERPAASCWIARTIFFKSVSVMPGTYAVTVSRPRRYQEQHPSRTTNSSLRAL
jgi:hypothetical protein